MRSLTVLIPLMVVLLIASCDGDDSESSAAEPSWAPRFEVKVDATFSPRPEPSTEYGTACPTTDELIAAIQTHQGAVSELQSDKKSSVETHLSAVESVGLFAALPHCYPTSVVAAWDGLIASFWRSLEEEPIVGFSYCDAVVGMWNPALLLVDAIQHTGASSIVNHFSDRGASTCMASYDDSVQATAWLEQFGSGALVRVAHPGSLDRLTDVLSDPTLLGLGLCPLTEHANASLGAANCIRGFDTGMCAGVQDVGSEMYALGLASMRITDMRLETTILTEAQFDFPQTYFGAPTNDMFRTATSGPLAQMCAAGAGGGGGISALSGLAAVPGSACILALVSEHETTGDRIVKCSQRHLGSRIDPITPNQVDPIKLNGCAVSTPAQPTAHELTNDEIDRQKAKKMDEELKKYGVTLAGTHEGGVSAALATPVHRSQAAFDNAANAVLTKHGSPVPSGTRGIYMDGMIFLNPSTLPPGSFEETAVLRHEQWHSYLEARGFSVDSDAPVGDEGLHHYLFGKGGIWRPADPDSPDGCAGSAANERAAAFMQCAFPGEATRIDPKDGLGPLIIPADPDAGSLPQACNDLDAAAVRMALGGGVINCGEGLTPTPGGGCGTFVPGANAIDPRFLNPGYIDCGRDGRYTPGLGCGLPAAGPVSLPAP